MAMKAVVAMGTLGLDQVTPGLDQVTPGLDQVTLGLDQDACLVAPVQIFQAR